jgi:hypothetical protein
MPELDVLEVIVFDRYHTIPHEYYWGSVILLDINGEPRPMWVGSRDEYELNHIAISIARGTGEEVISAHFLTPAQFNEAICLTFIDGCSPWPKQAEA